jgi:NADPH:quinone reductase-like Zn-dependent oxidoreductase
MKAAIVTAPGQSPIYADFPEPPAIEGLENMARITVIASALSPLSKSRSSGSHYSASGIFPAVAGVDGVGRTASGQRVYFAMPETPYGALAELTLVDAERCIPIPDSLDDIAAAALANPGMSSWAALVERAHIQLGETVLINGATGSAGRLAIQLAKHLGAGKIIATGRNPEELQQLSALGADVTIPFQLDASNPQGAQQYEEALLQEFTHGIDIVLDYLWGESAHTLLIAIAKAVDDGHPVRFVQIGEASREATIQLPAAVLRSSSIQLMGSGLRSVPYAKLLASIRGVFEAAIPANLEVAVKTMPLSAIAEAWAAPAKPRIVITIPSIFPVYKAGADAQLVAFVFAFLAVIPGGNLLLPF